MQEWSKELIFTETWKAVKHNDMEYFNLLYEVFQCNYYFHESLSAISRSLKDQRIASSISMLVAWINQHHAACGIETPAHSTLHDPCTHKQTEHHASAQGDLCRRCKLCGHVQLVLKRA